MGIPIKEKESKERQRLQVNLSSPPLPPDEIEVIFTFFISIRYEREIIIMKIITIIKWIKKKKLNHEIIILFVVEK